MTLHNPKLGLKIGDPSGETQIVNGDLAVVLGYSAERNHLAVEGYGMSPDDAGARSISQLLRDVADTIDAELGNAVPATPSAAHASPKPSFNPKPRS